MKKIISFDKTLDFNCMIGNISSISLDHTLKFIDSSNVKGELLISGSYKLTEASRLEDNFEFKIPVEIILTEVIDLDSADIEIEDFSYHVENNDTLVCHIEIKVEGLEKITLDEKEELLEEEIQIESNNEELVLNRECDGDIKENISNKKSEDLTIDIKEIENTKEEENIEESITTDNVGSLFSSFKDSDETFSTYSVYIIRNDESIESILNKYKITKEQLEDYNDLSNIKDGSKLIIPASNEID